LGEAWGRHTMYRGIGRHRGESGYVAGEREGRQVRCRQVPGTNGEMLAGSRQCGKRKVGSAVEVRERRYGEAVV